MPAGRVADDVRWVDDLPRVAARSNFGPEPESRRGARGGCVTDGLVLLAAWLEFLVLLGVLGYLLLRRRGR
jgi:hypothetical protein